MCRENRMIFRTWKTDIVDSLLMSATAFITRLDPVTPQKENI